LQYAKVLQDVQKTKCTDDFIQEVSRFIESFLTFGVSDSVIQTTIIIVIQSEAKDLDNINLCASEILHYTSFRSE